MVNGIGFLFYELVMEYRTCASTAVLQWQRTMTGCLVTFRDSAA